MAKLPQIDLAVPSLRLPAARPPFNPVPEATRRLADTFQGQTEALGSILIRQHQINQDHKALTEFYDKLGDLETTIESVKDPQEKLRLAQTGFNDLASDIHEDYPGMSDIANQQLNHAAIVRRTGTIGRIYNQIDKQNHQDYKAILSTIPKQASLAKSDEEVREIESYGTNLIRQARDLGTISEAQAGKDEFNMHYGIRYARFTELAVNHPDQALLVNQQESTLIPKDYQSRRDIAIKNVENRNSLTDAYVKKNKNQERDNVYNGVYADNPGKLQDLHESGTIDRGTYEYGMSHIPENETARYGLEDLIENTPWETTKELNEFKSNWIRGNHLLGPGDQSYLNGKIEEKIRDLKDPQSKNATDLEFQFMKYTRANGAHMQGNPRNSDVVIIEQQLKRELKNAKTIDEQGKLYDKAKQNFDKLMGVGEFRKPFHKEGEPVEDFVHDNFDKLMSDPRFR